MLHTQMDADRFVKLYDETLTDVYRYASRLTGGDRIRTDELVQETYLGIMRRLADTDRAPVEPSRSYVIVACRNRFLDQLRSERRRRDREEQSISEAGEASPIDPADLTGGAAIAALAQLSDDQRAALVLRYIDDLTVADVGSELGRSERATESLLVRARSALRTAYLKGKTT